MKSYVGVGVAVGVLAGLWTQVSIEVTLITWLTFVSWASFNGAVAIAVTVLGLVLCLQAALPLLSFIPGAFVGTAVFFGASFDVVDRPGAASRLAMPGKPV